MLYPLGGPATGFAGGAYAEFGLGRVYVSSESSMFTALSNGHGMQNPNAPGNEQLLRNIAVWLAGDDPT